MREQWLWPPTATHHHLMAPLIPAETKLYAQLVCPPCGEISQQHVLTPTSQPLAIIAREKKKKKEFGRRMEEPTLAGDSSCSNVVVTHCRDQNFIQFTAEQPYREQKMWPLFSPTRPSCLTAGGHMLVNGRALTAAVLRVKTDPSPDLGRVQMLLTFFE